MAKALSFSSQAAPMDQMAAQMASALTYIALTLLNSIDGEEQRQQAMTNLNVGEISMGFQTF